MDLVVLLGFALWIIWYGRRRQEPERPEPPVHVRILERPKLYDWRAEGWE